MNVADGMADTPYSTAVDGMPTLSTLRSPLLPRTTIEASPYPTSPIRTYLALPSEHGAPTLLAYTGPPDWHHR